MNGIQWAYPMNLKLLLVALPLLWAFWYMGWRGRVATRKQYAEEHLARRSMRSISSTSEVLQLTAWSVLLSLIFVAAAGPVKLDVPEKVPAGTLQVVLATDTSDSMLCEDYRPLLRTPSGQPGESVAGPYGNRLQVAKKICIEQIMPAIDGNELGVVIFSGDGRPFWEFSHDFSPVIYVMRNWMRAGDGPGYGSNVAEGLSEALEMFDREKDDSKEKVIIILSDGGFTSKPEDMAKVTAELQRRKVHVIVVGMGLHDAKPIPRYLKKEFLGYKTSQKDSSQLKTSAIDEPSLQKLAADTQGEYHPVGPDMKVNIKWTATLPNTRPEPRKSPLFQYPMGAAMLLLLAISILGVFRRSDVA